MLFNFCIYFIYKESDIHNSIFTVMINGKLEMW
jgi:hypothetical protein